MKRNASIFLIMVACLIMAGCVSIASGQDRVPLPDFELVPLDPKDAPAQPELDVKAIQEFIKAQPKPERTVLGGEETAGQVIDHDFFPAKVTLPTDVYVGGIQEFSTCSGEGCMAMPVMRLLKKGDESYLAFIDGNGVIHQRSGDSEDVQVEVKELSK